MKAEWYRQVCLAIDQVCPHRRGRKQQFGDHVVLRTYFWAVGWGRPVSWACEEDNWLAEHRRGALPSQPTMSRRLRTVGVLGAMERVGALLVDRFPGELAHKSIDSRPLRVSEHTHDADAKRGRAAGGMAKGYKIHGVLRRSACAGVLWPWTLTAMNTNDQVAAVGLLKRLGEAPGAWGYVSADNQYDANPVHAAAAAANHQLLAPPRKANAHVRDKRRNTAARLRSMDLCGNPLAACGARDTFGGELLGERRGIEQNFGHAAMLGLGSPPPWVRRPRRVALWVAAMLVLQLIRQLEIQRLRS